MINRPVVKTLFVGFLFWSWGGYAGWRTLQMQSLPYPQVQAFRKDARKLPAPKNHWNGQLLQAQKQAPAAKTGFAAVKAAWGDEASKLLSVFKGAAR